jgi:hypothetical protein
MDTIDALRKQSEDEFKMIEECLETLGRSDMQWCWGMKENNGEFYVFDGCSKYGPVALKVIKFMLKNGLTTLLDGHFQFELDKRKRFTSLDKEEIVYDLLRC